MQLLTREATLYVKPWEDREKEADLGSMHSHSTASAALVEHHLWLVLHCAAPVEGLYRKSRLTDAENKLEALALETSVLELMPPLQSEMLGHTIIRSYCDEFFSLAAKCICSAADLVIPHRAVVFGSSGTLITLPCPNHTSLPST